MSYLHCHTKDCGWSQDDFYTYSFRLKDFKKLFFLEWDSNPFGYNVFSKILSSIKWLIRPRFIGWDVGFILYGIPEQIEYTGVNIKIKDNKCFSWSWLILEIVKNFKMFKRMKYKTYKQFKADTGAVCPKCGLSNFDID